MIPLIIGSYALAKQLDWLNIPHNLNPKDIDIICATKKDADDVIRYLKEDSSECKLVFNAASPKFKTYTRAYKCDGVIFEITHAETVDCTTYELAFHAAGDILPTVVVNGINFKVASIDMLYSLKWSHRFLKDSPHFLKTMRTIRNLRSPAVGANPWDTGWIERRIAETYNYDHVKLNVKKNEFFNSNFNYVYDHDSIHEAVKLMEKPAYTYYMATDAEVECSREKFFACEQYIRLLGVLEETYVLALERSQIPNDFKVDPYKSFLMALEKVCTSITSGWFRAFAWENYEIIVRMYDAAYVDKFKYALRTGKIEPYSPNIGETHENIS
ncbi:hypothetical protein [Acinetobacter phage AbTZA1]|uniref:Uncharacterized protein n=1 Tax=Acinetobacter phage AbTZA1 TaxID=2500827 RepID=A0A3Q9R6W9_9CAUD|nr:hypothetical protein HYP74_gp028 [Acinetobacter phage AbTZA1]AZU98570.1 hypothetical protein [Acinetobacter phage AbTZA1]